MKIRKSFIVRMGGGSGWVGERCLFSPLDFYSYLIILQKDVLGCVKCALKNFQKLINCVKDLLLDYKIGIHFA